MVMVATAWAAWHRGRPATITAVVSNNAGRGTLGDDASEKDLYQAARTALAQHMWRHHDRGHGWGTLADRIQQHDELHYQMKRLGRPVSHRHHNEDDNEDLFDIAARYLQEGEAQHGSTNATKDSRPA